MNSEYAFNKIIFFSYICINLFNHVYSKKKITSLTIHRDIFKFQKNKTTKLIIDEKAKYINDKISSSSNSKFLYSVFNNLTGKHNSRVLPSDTPTEHLPDRFNTFFIDKISNIRSTLDSVSISQNDVCTQYDGPTFKCFSNVTSETIKKTIMCSKKSFCEFDFLPADLFIECIDILLPFITDIFNNSLSTGVFPSDFKNSLVIPLLKKSSLDPNVLKNYRPVTNLSFISKILEKIVFNQLVSHLNHNDLIVKFQSAYRSGHSTETALLKVANDLLCNIDSGDVAMLTMLDLSAAFDTLDHDILIHRLSFTFGLSDNVLNWFKSYLSDRKQKIKIDNFYSDDIPISFGVPQGSVLGPLLFTMYMYPLSKLINSEKFGYHLYADDTQLYCSFKPSSLNATLSDVQSMTDDVNNWMVSNKLKMNCDKTEVMLCGTRAKLKNIDTDSIVVCNDLISLSSNVRNLGFFFDQNFNLNVHISQIRKSCYFEIRRISHLRPFIDEKSTIQLIISLVFSKLDYCNCLFYNMSEENFQKLQVVQNHCARLIKKAPKRSSATSLLKELHWLPIKFRVSYKVALFVFKCLNDDSFPSYLKDLISVYTPSRTLRSSDKFLLFKPTVKLATFGEKSFYFSAPDVWNSLPYDLRSCTLFSTFKKKLKTFFFRQAFNC